MVELLLPAGITGSAGGPERQAVSAFGICLVAASRLLVLPVCAGRL